MKDEDEATDASSRLYATGNGVVFDVRGSEPFILSIAQAYHGSIVKIMATGETEATLDAEPPKIEGMAVVADADAPEPIRPDTPVNRLRAWYKRLTVPSARRGRVQDHVMLYIYWLSLVQGQERVMAREIADCFTHLGQEVPKVSACMASLRRETKFIRPVPHGTRDHQLLTRPGKTYIELRFRIINQ